MRSESGKSSRPHNIHRVIKRTARENPPHTAMAEELQQPKAGSPSIAKAAAHMKEVLGKEGNMTKAMKRDDGWEMEMEVVEQSEFMKKIGIAKPVYDKNIYRVILDRNFELVSYERRSQKPLGGAAE
mgnify:CR=1 FL=1